ncbi:MAG: DUF4038 domain-containing protein [Armatimonadota bacterium]
MHQSSANGSVARLRSVLATLFMVCLLALGGAAAAADYLGTLPLPQVSQNGRYLVKPDGSPFIWQGDTGWKAFYRLTREDADLYLRDRAAKGFTVIQAVVTPIHQTLDVTNVYGEPCMLNRNPYSPNEAFFRHVDYIVQRAEELGLYVAMLPTWGNYIRYGPFNSEDAAYFWGRFLGARYRNRPVIWVTGGDDYPEGLQQYSRAMAKGLIDGGGSEHLITYHPGPNTSGGQWFQAEPWFGFNMMQTGHYFDSQWSYVVTERAYALQPVKPVVDGEPGYENIPAFDGRGRLDAYEVRKFNYWALFAGACGVTYGQNDVWQFYDPALYPAEFGANTHWKVGLDFPGSHEMRHSRALLESRPFLTRIPDQGLLASDPGTGTDHTRATRASDGAYAFVYSASGKPFSVRTDRLSGSTLQAYWFDPRTGHAIDLGRTPNTRAVVTFTPPSSGRGHDWILVLDDAARGFKSPGDPLENQPPQVSAGPDQQILLGETATLQGSASDDGKPNPPGALTITWSAVSGPGTVRFANASSPSTTATFSAAGTYTLRLTAKDGEYTLSDQVSVSVVTDKQPEAPAGFVKGINFNGPAVTIEGNRWLSHTEALSQGLTVGNAWKWAGSYSFPHSPTADADTRTMLQSCLYQSSAVAVRQTLASGEYDLYLWTIENYQSNYRSLVVRAEGVTLASGVGELPLGHWRKLGPYRVSVRDGALDLEVSRLKGDPVLFGLALFGTSGGEEPPPPATYSVSGRVTLGTGGLAGVTMKAGTQTATTTSDGRYLLTGLAPGSYTVTAEKSGYTFSPASHSVTVGPDRTGIDFTAAEVTAETYSISGRVTLGTSGLPEVLVKAGARSVSTGPDGSYSLAGLAAGTYTVSASKSGYTFSPASQSVTVGPNRGSVNFSATADPPASTGFVKGINFHGPAVTIEGRRWLSHSEALSEGLSVTGWGWSGKYSFTLSPAADTDTRTMLESVAWHTHEFTVQQALPDGQYEIYLWMLENYESSYRSTNVSSGGVRLATGLADLPLGHWRKYGPYPVTVAGGVLRLVVSKGTKGDPTLAGLEIYRK